MISLLRLFTLLVLLSCSACTVTPWASRDAAYSVGAGEMQIDTAVLPIPGIATTYGVGTNLDVGLNLSAGAMITGWARYSLLNNPGGFSLAATTGIFGEGDYYESDGAYLGGILSWRASQHAVFTAGYRYAVANYRTYNEDNDNDYALFAPNELTNSEDLSKTGQLSLTANIRLKSHLQLNIGAACQYYYEARSTSIDSEICIPIAGLSFFNR